MTLSEIINVPIFDTTPWVIFFPLAGLLINLLIGKKAGEKTVGFIACLATGLSFVLSVILLMALRGSEEVIHVKLADWISIGNFAVSWTFRVDTLSTVMMLVVSGVGTLIHIYAVGYMHDDVRHVLGQHQGDVGHYRRFFVYFNLFIVAMLLLVTADNYLMLFVGWEGVGLCSYLLIGFWFDKGTDGVGNARAGKKAFIVNRIGDFGLLMAMFLLFGAFGTLQFDQVFNEASSASSGLILAVTLFMLLGVAGKSAQLPLYVWLPDAMAGPTPVSALIHAATMVTAGVYLIVRSSALFALAPAASNVVMWVGALTAIFAATIAVAQYDIKRVLAYSTISQLGFMVAAAGMGAYVAAMFHLATHAFFKALLFLSAGSVIQGMERGAGHLEPGDHSLDPQDMRNMGGLDRRMRVTFWVYLIGALAISGIAPLAGFFSKDEILGAARTQSMPVYVILVITAFLTAFYMGRQVFLVFSGKPRSKHAEHATESVPIITVTLVMLAVLSIAGGAFNLPGINTLGVWLERTLGTGIEVEFSWLVAIISLVVALLGLVFAWTMYGRVSLGKNGFVDPLSSSLGGLFRVLHNKWWVDEVYHVLIVVPFTWVCNVLMGEWIDQEVIDGAVNDVGSLSRVLSNFTRKFNNGYIRTYALGILLGAVAIVFYFIVR